MGKVKIFVLHMLLLLLEEIADKFRAFCSFRGSVKMLFMFVTDFPFSSSPPQEIVLSRSYLIVSCNILKILIHNIMSVFGIMFWVTLGEFFSASLSPDFCFTIKFPFVLHSSPRHTPDSGGRLARTACLGAPPAVECCWDSFCLNYN